MLYFFTKLYYRHYNPQQWAAFVRCALQYPRVLPKELQSVSMATKPGSFTHYLSVALVASRTLGYFQKYFPEHPLPPIARWAQAEVQNQPNPRIATILSTEDYALYRCLAATIASKHSTLPDRMKQYV